MTNRFGIRRQQRKAVDNAYENLTDLLDDNFEPCFFNRTDVLSAERRGFPVLDGLLGYILNGTHPPDKARDASELLVLVREAIGHDDVENSCHNLHGAVALMLNAIGCPAIVVWGTVHASAPGTDGFVLNANIAPQFPGHRPGHAWIMTPYNSVNDVALAHGYNVGNHYESLMPSIPKLIQISGHETSEPDVGWWHIPSSQSFRLDGQKYADSTKYQDVIGWSQATFGELTIRYLPGAVSLPEEADLNDIKIRIGGQLAGDFFSENWTP